MKREPPKGWKLYERADALTAPAVTVGKGESCWPHHLSISPKTHSAICSICEREFTAWDALLYITRHWPLLTENLKRLQGDIKLLEERRAALRRECANLKATKRRHTKGTAP
jgi:hypothetical protein